MNHLLIGHILIGWGFWLSGIAIGYIAAKRDWRAAAARARLDLETTTSGVDLGPWIERCKEER